MIGTQSKIRKAKPLSIALFIGFLTLSLVFIFAWAREWIMPRFLTAHDFFIFEGLTILFSGLAATVGSYFGFKEYERIRQILETGKRVIESSPAVLFRWRTDEGWPVEYVSDNIDQFGYKAEELLSWKVPYVSIIHPDDVDRVTQEIEAFHKKGLKNFQQEYRILTKIGEVRWVEDRSEAVYDKHGRATHYQGIVIDVTARKQAEEALRESEERFRTIFECSRDARMLLTEKSFFDCNPRTLEIFAVTTKEEFIKLHPADLSPPQQLNGEASLAAAMKHIQTAYQEGTDYFEWVHRRANGEDFPAEVLLSAFYYGGQRVLQATVRDITQRKKLEKEFQASEARYHTLIETSPEAITLADRGGNLLVANQSMLRLHGCTKMEEVIGKNVSVFIAPEDHAQIKTNIQKAIATGTLLNIEHTLLKKDGSRFSAELSLTVNKDEHGDPISITTIARDITEKKLAEERLKESEQKFRAIFENAKDAIVVADIETQQFYLANPEICRLLGYTPDEFRNLRVQDIHPQEALPLVLSNFERMAAGENLTLYDAPVKKKDGAVIYADISSAPYVVGGKKYLLGIFRETTARKKEQERLNKLNTCLLAAGPDFNVNINQLVALSGELLGADCALYNRLEGSLLCTLGKWKTPVDFPLSDKPEGHICNDVILKGSDEAIVISDLQNSSYAKTDPAVSRYKLQTYLGKSVKRGQEVVGSLCVVFQKDFQPTEADKKLLSIVASAVSREENRKEAEEIQVRQTAFLQKLMDSIPSPVFYKNTAGVYLGCNKSFELLIGSPKEKIIGKTTHDLTSKELADKYQEMDAALFRLPGVQIRESYLEAPDGTLRNVVFNQATYDDAKGVLAGLVGVILDVTTLRQALAALKESEERFRIIFDNAEDGIVLVNAVTHQFRMVNNSFLKMLGYSPDEGKTLSVEKIHRAEDLPYVLTQFERPFKGENLVTDIPLKRKDGSVFYADVASVPISISGDTYLVALFRDMTERKKIEEALRESEEKYRSIFAASPESIVVLDLKGNIIDVNSGLYKTLGYQPQEIIGKNLLELPYLPESSKEEVRNRFMQRMKGEAVPPYELLFMAKNGEKKIGLVNAALIKDEKGQPVRNLVLISDITERKNVETILKESRYFLDKIVNSVADPIFVKDRQHHWVMLNDSYCQFMGYPREELIGKSDYDYFSKEEADVFWDRDEVVFKTEQENINEEMFTDARGVAHTIVTKKALYRDAQGAQFIVGVIRDITESKKAYQELQKIQTQLVQSEKLAALGRFSVGIAHEVKNPLGVVLGGIEFIEKKFLPRDTDITLALKKIKESTLRSNFILQNLLQYATPAELKLENVNLKDLIHDVTSLVKYRLPGSEVQIDTQLEEDNIQISVDRNQIQQVIFNLLINAVEAMSKGGKIKIRVLKTQSPELLGGRPVCVVEIKDSGEGIAKNDLPKLFEPFFTTKRDRKGTGLGLYTAKMIIDHHRGDLVLESKKGVGTTAKIVLPAQMEGAT